MSTPSSPSQADQFIRELLSDDAFRQQVEAADSGETLSALLAARGFRFTQEEWNEAVARIEADSTLNDEELDAVAGGGSVPYGPSPGVNWNILKRGFSELGDKIKSLF